MATKRKDGSWQETFVCEGKRHYVYAASKKELQEKIFLKKQKLAENRENHENPLLENYYKTFTEHRRSRVKESTLRNQRAWFQNCADILLPDADKKLGKMRIRDIKPNDIKYVQKQLISSGKNSTTVNDYMSHLSHVFSAAMKDETVDRNPCICIDSVRRTEPQARDTKHRALTEDELKRFFEKAKGSYFENAYRLMLYSGIRMGELGALLPSDVDVKDSVLHITKTITRDEIGAYIVGDTPKTDKSTRDIPLTAAMLDAINDQKKNMKKLFGPSINRQLFLTPEGLLLRDYVINREIKRICKLAEVEYFTCHAFRATFASMFMDQRSEDYKILSELLGHASTKITLDLYTHAYKDSKVAAMEALQIVI